MSMTWIGPGGSIVSPTSGVWGQGGGIVFATGSRFYWSPARISYNDDLIISGAITVTARAVPGGGIRSLTVTDGATLTFDDSYPSSLSIDRLIVSGESRVNVGDGTELRVQSGDVTGSSAFVMKPGSTLNAGFFAVTQSSFYNQTAIVTADTFNSDGTSGVASAGASWTINNSGLAHFAGFAFFALDDDSSPTSFTGDLILNAAASFEVTNAAVAALNVTGSLDFGNDQACPRWTAGTATPQSSYTYATATGGITSAVQSVSIKLLPFRTINATTEIKWVRVSAGNTPSVPSQPVAPIRHLTVIRGQSGWEVPEGENIDFWLLTHAPDWAEASSNLNPRMIGE